MIFNFVTLFFVLVVALLIERFFDCSRLRSWDWVLRYHAAIDRRFAGKNTMIMMWVMLLPIPILVSLIEFILRGFFYGVLGIVFELLVLLYCLGPRSVWQDGEVDSNRSHASTWLMFERHLFGPIFWFIVLGAGGAFLYRMAEVINRLLSKNSETTVFASHAKRIEDILDWLPVRILGFLFALGGHFVLVMGEWPKKIISSSQNNEAMLTTCGDTGLGLKEGSAPLPDPTFAKEALSLFQRSLVIFLVILALLILIVWR